MKLSHIILKVNDLDQAVKMYREKGFAVEYGKTKNPYNALIYFSKGPYLELLARTGMPNWIKKLMRLLGYGLFMDRMDRLDSCGPGYCELAFETYEGNFDTERAILAKYGVRSGGLPSRRVDTQGRDLRFKLLIPEPLDVPFFMTYFSVDPKPINFVHPNGVRRIGKVLYRTAPERFQMIRELCDDDRLELASGRGIEVEFEKAGA